MRTWIYNRIKALAGMPAAFGVGAAMRVTSSGAADSPTKPFMILVMGVEQPPLGTVSEMRVQQIPFTVWVHDRPGVNVNIDDACVALKNGLPTVDGAVVGGMSVYNVEWTDTGQDSYDDFFGTNCRPVRFTMMTRR